MLIPINHEIFGKIQNFAQLIAFIEIECRVHAHCDSLDIIGGLIQRGGHHEQCTFNYALRSVCWLLYTVYPVYGLGKNEPSVNQYVSDRIASKDGAVLPVEFTFNSMKVEE